MRSVFPWGVDFDEIFNSFFIDGTLMDAVSKLPNCLVSSTYPPTNVYEDDNKNYVIEVAVAGYSEDEINLNVEDMRVILELTPNKNKTPIYKQQGIRHSEGKISFGIHPRYDLKAIKATNKDGILTIKLPIKEEAKPSTITIEKNS
jgi:HSP20 family molecular chaperone IbpA